MDTPKKSTSDKAYAAVKGGLSAIPMIGGLVSEILPLLLQPPIDRRRDAWMEYVGEKLKELEHRGVNLEELGNDEEFVSAVLQATHSALRTHQKSKHELLRNALINIATKRSPEAALQGFFLNCINDFSDIHISMLKIYDERIPYSEIKNGDTQILLERIPELRNNSYVCSAFCAELISRGLVESQGWYMQPGPPVSYGSRATNMGKQLLSFISTSEDPAA